MSFLNNVVVLIIILKSSSAYIEYVEAKGCESCMLMLTCRHFNSVIAVFNATFEPFEENSTYIEDINSVLPPVFPRIALNRRCSGVNYCSFILTEDCPGATRWGPGNFSVTYACIAERRMTKYCNYNITLPSPEVIGISEGFIRNPGYPLYYLGLQECRWIIQAPPMQRIKIIILDLSLISTNRDPEDCQDLFEIKESGTTRFVSCLQVEPPKVVISLGRTVEIYLRASETIVPRRGLLFYYSALGCPTPDSPKDGYLVFRNDTYALFSCCVGYAFADTMLRTKELICLGHNWNYKLPVANCIEKNKLDSYSQEVIKAQAKMTESLTDVVLPSIIIIALFIVNSIVLFFIYRYKKRKNALYIREEEEMKTMRSPENS